MQLYMSKFLCMLVVPANVFELVRGRKLNKCDSKDLHRNVLITTQEFRLSFFV